VTDGTVVPVVNVVVVLEDFPPPQEVATAGDQAQARNGTAETTHTAKRWPDLAEPLEALDIGPEQLHPRHPLSQPTGELGLTPSSSCSLQN